MLAINHTSSCHGTLGEGPTNHSCSILDVVTVFLYGGLAGCEGGGYLGKPMEPPSGGCHSMRFSKLLNTLVATAMLLWISCRFLSSSSGALRSAIAASTSPEEALRFASFASPGKKRPAGCRVHCALSHSTTAIKTLKKHVGPVRGAIRATRRRAARSGMHVAVNESMNSRRSRLDTQQCIRTYAVLLSLIHI